MIVREPHLETAKVRSLLPTQITVGLREVQEKRKHWRAQRHKLKFLSHHLVPVIRGPKDHYYIIDHHHLVRAMALAKKAMRFSKLRASVGKTSPKKNLLHTATTVSMTWS